MKTIKITITVADLDAALAVPWDSRTCLLSQAVARTFATPPKTCAYGRVVLPDGRRIYVPDKIASLQMSFDLSHGPNKYAEETSSEDIRAQLPLTFTAELSR